MKKEYMKPELRVVLLQHQTHLLVGSNFGVSSNLATSDEFFYIGGGTENGR